MKIAVPFENGMIFQHFGHTEQVKLYDVENGLIVRKQIVDANWSGHDALIRFLCEETVDVIICGGIGSRAQTALSRAGIKLYSGVSGGADEMVNIFLIGRFHYCSETNCICRDFQNDRCHHRAI